ncbi:hypothetical protein [Nocardia sp. NPDC051570]|uniref:hypothetical protein n=1 Tax=Nocardia sp. NPDC051570 TaxID=3364324 RepID=UPI0037B0EEB4
MPTPAAATVAAAFQRFCAAPRPSTLGPASWPRPIRRGYSTTESALAAQQRRRRVRFADADTVRERLLRAADDLRLTGARRNVLAAVLRLLCGWSRISDDRVRIHQIITLCGPHRHGPKTVGRVLAALQRDEFILYTPAQGRGTFATIAIHPRFLDGICELERDQAGRVITFSRPSPYSSKRKHLPTLRWRSGDARPDSVTVDAGEVREVLANVPEPFRSLPARLRWCLGKEIRTYLARGWRPDQLLTTLRAALPEQVRRPLLLARYRFRHNLIGAGPRLAPAQRAWDRRHRAEDRARYDAQQRRHAAAVFTATTAAIREKLLTALRNRLHLSTPLPDHTTAVIHAARLARRAFPEAPLREAVDRWIAQFYMFPAHADVPESNKPFTAAEPDRCVACGANGTPRQELPLRSIVCDRCWSREGM